MVRGWKLLRFEVWKEEAPAANPFVSGCAWQPAVEVPFDWTCHDLWYGTQAN